MFLCQCRNEQRSTRFSKISVKPLAKLFTKAKRSRFSVMNFNDNFMAAFHETILPHSIVTHVVLDFETRSFTSAYLHCVRTTIRISPEIFHGSKIRGWKISGEIRMVVRTQCKYA